MPNLPFRIAFWALCFALGLTVVTTVAQSEPVRLVLRWGGTTVPNESRTDSARPLRRPIVAGSSSNDALRAPLRVASTDERTGLGIGVPNEPLHEQPQPPPAVEVPREAAFNDNALNIPVPDPVLEMPPLPPERELPPPAVEAGADRIANTEEQDRPAADVPYEQIARLQSEVDHLRDELVDLRLARNPFLSRPTEADWDATTVDSASPALPRGVTIEPSDRTGRFTFRFQSASLPDVLHLLGRYAGWSVIVAPDLTGEFTGEFLDEDPGQAFVLVVKSRHCSVTRRGHALLIDRKSR